jgi:hypothetical protein
LNTRVRGTPGRLQPLRPFPSSGLNWRPMWPASTRGGREHARYRPCVGGPDTPCGEPDEARDRGRAAGGGDPDRRVRLAEDATSRRSCNRRLVSVWTPRRGVTRTPPPSSISRSVMLGHTFASLRGDRVVAFDDNLYGARSRAQASGKSKRGSPLSRQTPNSAADLRDGRIELLGQPELGKRKLGRDSPTTLRRRWLPRRPARQQPRRRPR